MNHIYRLVFNRSLGHLQAASEITAAHGKSGSVGAVAISLSPSTEIPLSRVRYIVAATTLALGGLSVPAMADTTLTTGGAQTLTQAGSTYDLPGGETISGTTGSTGGNASGTSSTAGNGTDGGVALTGIDYVLLNDGQVVGGIGGAGGTASGNWSRSGNGGTGGAGVSGTDFELTNTGTVSGGLGGGAGGSGWGYGGDGGNGGAAVSGAGFTLINSGIITGGNGLGGGNASSQGGKGGNGGAGVVATGNATIYNAGTISGGTPGNGGPGPFNAGAGTAGSAIELSGGGNTVVLQDNSVITGNLVSTSGSTNGGDALILEGTQSNALDATGIQGFASYTKRGSGTWSLTGTPAPIITMTTVMVPMDPMDCVMFGPPCSDIPTQVPVSLPNVTSWDIQAGTLSIGSDSNLGDVSGGLALSGGTLLTTADVSSTRDITLTQNTVSSIDNGGHNDIFAGVISGGGGLTFAGSGTTLMTGYNSYTGMTTISGGTLAIGASAGVISDVVNHAAFENAGTVGGSVSNGAGATFTQTGGSVAGGLSNSGTVNANGGALDGAIANNAGGRFAVGGTVTSNGTFDNAHDATLAVLGAGDYRLGGLLTNAGDVTIAAGGTLTAGGIRNTASGSITNDGTVNDDLDNAGLYTNNAIQNARVASNTGTLVNSQGATWTGDFATAGIVNNDGTIDGSLTQSAGTTTNNGRITGAVLINGGLYSGSGSTGALTVGNGATFQPGSSATVNGDLVFQSGSTYRVNLDPAGASQTTATGLATLNGGTVDVQAGSGNYTPATGYTILSANGVTGRFADVSSNLAFLTPSLSYDANSVTLQMTRNDTGFATVSDTRNQRAAASAVDRLGMGNTVYDAVVQLYAAGARQAFDQLAGEVHASAQTALIEDSRFVREAALDRLRPGACGISGATTTLGANDRERPVDTGCDADQSVTWMRAFGSWGSVASDGNAAGLDHSTGGVLLGADREMENGARIGVLGGFSHTNFDVNDRHASGTSENYHLGVYAGKQWGALALRSGAAYAWHDLSSRRSVGFGGLSDSLRSDYHADTAQVFGEMGYALEAGAATLEPFVNLAYVDLHTDGFTERGGAAALSAKGGNSDATFSTLGLHGSTGLDLGGVRTNATGSLGWRHAFGDTTPTSSLSFASGSSSFFTAGVPIAKDVAVVDLGLDFSVGKNTTLGVSYSGQFGSGITDNGVRANFKLEF